ncbi:DUF859 family phage minor structural protein [Microbacterium sp. GXS0129]|uniref:DUF859 family phage minor structural protein n=1 Tax=Microbacterium sp. GXS0129 TaxID=3377836 RepID=UPI00383B8062
MVEAAFPNRPFRLRLEWQLLSQNIAANQSKMRFWLYIDKLSYSPTMSDGVANREIRVNGTVIGQTNASGFNFTGDGPWLILQVDSTLTHASDGVGSWNVVASGNYDILGATSINVTMRQPTIPRASTATFAGGPAFDAGSAVTINTNRASTAFTHKITYLFGTMSGTIATAAGASVSWTPPLSLLTMIPNATSGTGTIYVTTMNGTAQVGKTETGFTLRAPASVAPTIASLSVADDNPTVASVVGTFVQGLSILRATVNASGAQGSTIKTRKFKMSGTEVNSGGLIPVTAAGNVPITATATDSRNRTANWSGTLTVLGYANPLFSKVLVRRATSAGVISDTGTSLRIDLTCSVTSLVNSTQRNSMTIRVFTRPRGGTSWTARNVITGGLSYNSNFVVSGGANYPIDDSFEVRVELADKFNTSAAQSTVATAAVLMHWSKTGVGIGKFHERGTLDVAGAVYATGDITSDTIVRAAEFRGLLGRSYIDGMSPGVNIGNSGPRLGDLNDATGTGWYGTTPDSSQAALNTPPAGHFWNVMVMDNGGRATQYATSPMAPGGVYKRWRVNSTSPFVDWVKVYDENNYVRLPAAMAAGEVAHGAVGGNAGVSVTVTLPSGRFTQTPIIQLTSQSQQTLTLATITRSTTSVSIRVSNWATTASGSGSIGWTAIQMTEGSAAG